MTVNKVVYDGKTLIDLSGDSVTPETLAEGVTAHAASGAPIVGIAPTTAVRYTEQSLSDAQKKQARENIDAEPFVFEISYDPEEAGAPYPDGISYEDIVAAYTLGRTVVCKVEMDGNYIQCPLIAYMEGMVLFGVFADSFMAVMAMPEGIACQMIEIATGEDIPYELPNPNKLKLTGAVDATYDGSNEVTVDIPTIAGEKGDKGDAGKSAYAYAQDAGYTGTEAEFAEKLASNGDYDELENKPFLPFPIDRNSDINLRDLQPGVLYYFPVSIGINEIDRINFVLEAPDGTLKTAFSGRSQYGEHEPLETDVLYRVHINTPAGVRRRIMQFYGGNTEAQITLCNSAGETEFDITTEPFYFYDGFAYNSKYYSKFNRQMFTPTLDTHLVNKKYVDDAVASASGGSGGSGVSDEEALELLIELDLLPAVTNSAGAILTDSDSNSILRY